MGCVILGISAFDQFKNALETWVSSWVWWYISVIPALWRQRQEDSWLHSKFEDTVGQTKQKPLFLSSSLFGIKFPYPYFHLNSDLPPKFTFRMRFVLLFRK
jgi:hypothetical protein